MNTIFYPSQPVINNKTKTLSRFAIKFFPRSSSPTSPPPAPTSPTSSGCLTAESLHSSFTRRETPSPRIEQAIWDPSLVQAPPAHLQEKQYHQESGDAARCTPSHTPSHQQNPQSRSPRHHWFIPGRFRTSTGVNWLKSPLIITPFPPMQWELTTSIYLSLHLHFIYFVSWHRTSITIISFFNYSSISTHPDTGIHSHLHRHKTATAQHQHYKQKNDLIIYICIIRLLSFRTSFAPFFLSVTQTTILFFRFPPFSKRK